MFLLPPCFSQIAHLSSTDSIIWGFVLSESRHAWLVLMLGGEIANQICGQAHTQTALLNEPECNRICCFTSSWSHWTIYVLNSFYTLLRIHIITGNRNNLHFLWVSFCMESPEQQALLHLRWSLTATVVILTLLSLPAALCWDPRQLSHHVGTGFLFGELSVFIGRLRCCSSTWSPGGGRTPGNRGRDAREQHPQTPHPPLTPGGLRELAEAPYPRGVQPITWPPRLPGAPKSLD